jgi:hypothetical protein
MTNTIQSDTVVLLNELSQGDPAILAGTDLVTNYYNPATLTPTSPSVLGFNPLMVYLVTQVLTYINPKAQGFSTPFANNAARKTWFQGQLAQIQLIQANLNAMETNLATFVAGLP